MWTPHINTLLTVESNKYRKTVRALPYSVQWLIETFLLVAWYLQLSQTCMFAFNEKQQKYFRR